MKKEKNIRVTLLLFLCVICVSLFSCRMPFVPEEPFDLPSYSSEFDKDFVASFQQNYSLKDANLSYFQASPKIKFINEKNYGKLNDSSAIETQKFVISAIDGVSTDTFISVSHMYFEAVISVFQTWYSETYVYQSNGAPNPIEDWTVSKISVYRTRGVQDIRDSATQPFSHQGDKYPQIEILSLVGENADKLFKEVKNALTSWQGVDFRDNYIKSTPVGETYPTDYYYIVVHFNENPNIVWFSPLYSPGGNDICVLKCVYNEEDDFSNMYCTKPLEGEQAEILRKILIDDGWVPKK